MPADTAGEVAVIGAGIAGLSAASELQRHGRPVVVFDKGGGPGGRAARRRQGGHQFDHGAQFFTVRDARFAELVRSLMDAGVVAEWRPRVRSFGPSDREGEHRSPWYVAVPGMSALAKHVGADVDVRYGCRVDHARRGDAGWELTFGDGTAAGPFATLLVTAPAPQTAALLVEASPALADRMRGVRMLPCWATMLGFAEPLEAGFDAAFVAGPGPLRWIARNTSKPGRPVIESWVLHADPGWTGEHLEQEPERIGQSILDAFKDVVGVAIPEPTLTAAHRWRYALVERAVGEPCLFDPDRAVGAAGDWCLGPRIEAAFQSGLSVAAAVLARGVDTSVSARP